MSAPKRQRALQRRRQERVIHADLGTLGVRNLAHRRNVGQHHQRIAGRLDMHQLGVGLHRRFHRRQIAGVHVLDLDAVAGDDPVQQAHRAGIHILGTDQVIARAQHRHQRRDRRHARGKGMSAVSAFQSRQRLFQPVARGVAGARVIPAAVRADAGQLKGRGKVNGHIHSAGLRVRDIVRHERQGSSICRGKWP